MTDKALEIEMRLALEAAEELLTQISYQSDFKDVRILSVETVEEAGQREQAESSANVVTLESRRKASASTAISKALRFSDQSYHS
ncbi:hypothetical protein [uncultured Methylophaga sp.]|jgi:hypothetical protein|uniref:hypothetical protein n=1 Tax=uncultured Methylophaga sp. TaxID=285271 RepID=UPI002604507C|nr:hypothetical protein [uncultured Methylophaga sp.]